MTEDMIHEAIERGDEAAVRAAYEQMDTTTHFAQEVYAWIISRIPAPQSVGEYLREGEMMREERMWRLSKQRQYEESARPMTVGVYRK